MPWHPPFLPLTFLTLTPHPSKLIDVSQASQIDDQSSLSDYARLFGEAFPPSSGAKADDERVWIRNIIQHAAPNDRTWDWTSVQEIEGDLISSLDQDG